MIKLYFYVFSFLMIPIMVSHASASSFDEDINLECGPHLIAITQSIKQKLRSLGPAANGESVTWDVTTLRKGQHAGKLDPYHGAVAFEREIDLDDGNESFLLDRMKGHVTLYQRDMDYKWVRKGRYNCKLSTLKALKLKIKAHNDKVKKQISKRKF